MSALFGGRMRKFMVGFFAALLMACPVSADTKVDELAGQAKARFEKFMASVKGFTVTTEKGVLYFKGSKLRMDMKGDMGFAKGFAGGADSPEGRGLKIQAVMIFDDEQTAIISTLTGKQVMPKKGTG